MSRKNGKRIRAKPYFQKYHPVKCQRLSGRYQRFGLTLPKSQSFLDRLAQYDAAVDR